MKLRVTGAGATVIATMTLALAAAARRSRRCSSQTTRRLVVMKSGPDGIAGMSHAGVTSRARPHPGGDDAAKPPLVQGAECREGECDDGYGCRQQSVRMAMAVMARARPIGGRVDERSGRGTAAWKIDRDDSIVDDSVVGDSHRTMGARSVRARADRSDGRALAG